MKPLPDDIEISGGPSGGKVKASGPIAGEVVLGVIVLAVVGVAAWLLHDQRKDMLESIHAREATVMASITKIEEQYSVVAQRRIDWDTF